MRTNMTEIQLKDMTRKFYKFGTIKYFVFKEFQKNFKKELNKMSHVLTILKNVK